ncbi:DNA polymerase Y family protein [Corallincola luteus]|uniref:DNA polymerase Y family protein n=1 Tax=Corallincola luteus TaxID=1775177 RepID=A0ABY2ALL7_9GAMM|nr:DNA polymerase Y family protein [Corallincola luteus]TCI03865.1 DNA polymerase Y family protein [Corallincola luteus]
MLWLALDFPRLALDWCCRSHETSGVVVLLDRQQRVLQSSQQAVVLGVRPGMSLATLLALTDDITLLAEDQLVEGDVAQLSATALHAMALWAGDFASRILLFPPHSLLLEVGSMLRLFGGVEGYLGQLKRSLLTQDLSWQYAIAKTPRAAITLAQAGANWSSLDAKKTAKRLGDLAVESLPFTPLQQQGLSGLGLQTLSQLLALPVVEIRRRLGAPLLCWILELQGRLMPSFKVFSAPPRFELSQPLVAEIYHLHGLLFPLRRLLQGLTDYLRQRQLATTECLLTLSHRDIAATSIVLRSSSPETGFRQWWQLAQLQLEKQHLPAPVLGLSLCCEQLVAITSATTDLLQQRQGEGLTQGQLLGRLQSKLGEGAVYGMTVTGDHRPERSWKSVPPGTSVDPVMSASPVASSSRRPSWLLPVPCRLSKPDITILDGPERICSGWWQSASGDEVIRDYYLAWDQQGALCWIFKDASGEWFLHGWFG